MKNKTTLVLGATGTTGRRVAAALEHAGHQVRRAARNGEVAFDWTVPDTWPAATAGVGSIYLMAPDGVAVGPEFVASAVAGGVRNLVLLSSAGIEEMADRRLLEAERVVRHSGVDWTILRPSWFNQNFDEGFFHPSVMGGEVVMPVGDLRQAFVDAADIAAVAATALVEPGHAGRLYEVRGPQALTFTDAVGIIASASGRRVRFSGTPEAYVAAQLAAGRPREAALAEVEGFSALRRRGDDEPNEVVRQVTGRPPISFEVFARAAAARGAWRSG